MGISLATTDTDRRTPPALWIALAMMTALIAGMMLPWDALPWNAPTTATCPVGTETITWEDGYAFCDG